jgi:hypothetical protein
MQSWLKILSGTSSGERRPVHLHRHLGRLGGGAYVLLGYVERNDSATINIFFDPEKRGIKKMSFRLVLP